MYTEADAEDLQQLLVRGFLADLTREQAKLLHIAVSGELQITREAEQRLYQRLLDTSNNLKRMQYRREFINTMGIEGCSSTFLLVSLDLVYNNQLLLPDQVLCTTDFDRS